MRLQRLDLIRFGRFTESSFHLPVGARDLHIVFGPNEAGKSTALTAIEDLLFGIPMRSPYNFVHDYDAMLIGAVLENGTDRLEFRRRKGTKSTLLGLDDLPLAGDEGALAPFLGGADRPFFERMFNLGHRRLVEGGREILAAEGDVGQTLFSAGTGLSRLRERLNTLEEEADGLWAPRRSEKRLYYQANDRLKAASGEMRNCTLLARDWQRAKRTFENADENLQALQREHETKSADLNRMGRIRRVYAAVRRKEELRAEIGALGEMVLLPEDAARTIEKAERHETETVARIETLTNQLEQAEQEMAALTFDEVLVRRAEDIQQLHERRIEVRRETVDLPKRRDELEAAVGDLRRLASEIGWASSDTDSLVERIPLRDKVAIARSLLQQRGELLATVQTANDALDEARRVLAEKEERLREIGQAANVSKLTATINSTRGSVDVEARTRSTQDQVNEGSLQIERLRQALKPKLPDEIDITTLPVPPRGTVQEHRDRSQNVAQRLRETSQRLDDARLSLAQDRQALERRIEDEGVETLDALRGARTVRDDIWNLLKRQYIDGLPVSEDLVRRYAARPDDLSGNFEDAVREADAVADRRFDKAEAAGSLTELARNISERENDVERLAMQKAGLGNERDRLETAWRSLWTDLPAEADSPDTMLVWLDGRDGFVDAVERQRQAKRQLEALKTERRDARSRLFVELDALGVDTEAMHVDTLPVLVERAADYERDQKTLARRLEEARDSMRTARTDLARREKEVETAGTAWSSWERAWSTALSELSLDVEAAPEAAATQISVIDQMREAVIRVKELRDRRIGPIERDIAEFQRVVRDEIGELAPDLTGAAADEAVLELERRINEALDLHRQHKDRADAAKSLRRQIEVLQQDRREAWATVQPLKQTAGKEDIVDLKDAIERSDRWRALDLELARVRKTLQQDGDGLSIDALTQECEGVDIDQVRARQETVATDVKVLQERLNEAAEQRAEARQVFQAISGGDDAAAKAAAERQEAIAAMREVAERYVRFRTSAMLLRWAIDRFRQEKQGPLLKRAGELFQVLTMGSFDRLSVQFDDQDQMRLAGVRPNGEVVSVPGLTSGTEDQLFLALRIAAIEDYLARATALPFVADDLFINFDPDRSAAGFDILGQLAEKTQVLFFTHHPHLVDIAQNRLGSNTHVLTLEK